LQNEAWTLNASGCSFASPDTEDTSNPFAYPPSLSSLTGASEGLAARAVLAVTLAAGVAAPLVVRTSLSVDED
jgi:hypothetical protein